MEVLRFRSHITPEAVPRESVTPEVADEFRRLVILRARLLHDAPPEVRNVNPFQERPEVQRAVLQALRPQFGLYYAATDALRPRLQCILRETTDLTYNTILRAAELGRLGVKPEVIKQHHQAVQEQAICDTAERYQRLSGSLHPALARAIAYGADGLTDMDGSYVELSLDHLAGQTGLTPNAWYTALHEGVHTLQGRSEIVTSLGKVRHYGLGVSYETTNVGKLTGDETAAHERMTDTLAVLVMAHSGEFSPKEIRYRASKTRADPFMRLRARDPSAFGQATTAYFADGQDMRLEHYFQAKQQALQTTAPLAGQNVPTIPTPLPGVPYPRVSCA